jgi:hypothetical protein
MKRKAVLDFLLVALLVQSASAGSAVAIGSNGRLGAAAGWPLNEARQRALKICIQNGGVNPRIFAATNVVGEGAVAVGGNGNGKGSIIGVALGRPSASDAANRAIEACQKAGGTDPKIIRAFKG